MPPEARTTTPLQSLTRGLEVLEAFDASRPSMTLSEVARTTGMTRASARRVLHTLEHLGHVRCQLRQFSLTPRVLRLGWGYLASLGAEELARDVLRDLAARTSASSSLAVLDGDEIVLVVHAPAGGTVQLALAVGQRLPADATAAGALLSSAAPRVPWTLVDGRLEAGVRTLAAPVGPRGRPVAALQLALAAPASSPPSAHVLEALTSAAQALSTTLALTHPSPQEDPCA